MSIRVPVAELEDAVSRFGPTALLVTAAGGAPHVSSVVVAFDGEILTMGAGNTTRRNVGQNPAVVLVWTGDRAEEHCLIVDATAPDPAADPFFVRPVSGVLHRLASSD